MAFVYPDAEWDFAGADKLFYKLLDQKVSIQEFKRELERTHMKYDEDWFAASLLDMINTFAISDRMIVLNMLGQYLTNYRDEKSLMNQILPKTLQKMQAWSAKEPSSELLARINRVKPFVLPADFRLPLVKVPPPQHTQAQHALYLAARKSLEAQRLDRKSGREGVVTSFRLDGKEYVVKTFRMSVQRAAVHKEAEYQQKAAEFAISPRILLVHATFDANEPVFLVMDKMERELEEDIRKTGEIAERYQHELLAHLKTLDKLKIRHNDLTGHNIMLDKRNHVQIVDFGAAVARSRPNNLDSVYSVWREAKELGLLKKDPQILLGAPDADQASVLIDSSGNPIAWPK